MKISQSAHPVEGRGPDDNWAVAMFSSRESEQQLLGNIRTVLAASRHGAPLTLDILINGNPGLARSIRPRLATLDLGGPHVSVQLWHLEPADKAAAWNRYVHEIVPANALAFFVDGYVSLEPNCLHQMVTALSRSPGALAVTCLPSVGRSASALRKRMAEEGGIYGNVYALRAETIRRLRQLEFRLPIGIYRTDPTLSAALMFNLDPAKNKWRSDRIAVASDAVYRVPVLSMLNPADVKSGLKRRLRQAQGSLECRAVREIFRSGSVTGLPVQARDLILRWADANRTEVRSLVWADPLAFAMLSRIRNSEASTTPAGSAECLQRIVSPAMGSEQQPVRSEFRIAAVR